MKVVALLLVAVVVQAERVKDQCTEKVASLQSNDPSAWVPECTNKGNFMNKQCDNKGCWCVTKRRGRNNFNSQKVPLNHYYDCKRIPQVCLRNELQILLTNPNPGRLPQCDCNGYYESIQCEAVSSDLCSEGVKRKRRSHPPCNGPTSTVGYDVVSRPKLDSAAVWTFVSQEAFTVDGTINAFEIYVGERGEHRPLRIGVYKPTGADKCEFELMQQIEYPDGFDSGYQLVDIDSDSTFAVQAGWRYGFTWTEKGVINYENADTKNYCEAREQYEQGDTAVMTENVGERTYSIRLTVSQCDTNQCDQCYCVNPNTGVEIPGTRTFDENIDCD